MLALTEVPWLLRRHVLETLPASMIYFFRGIGSATTNAPIQLHVLGANGAQVTEANHSTIDNMQPEMKCAVCSQQARGFHFGAFTCEGCKSFFGRNAQTGSQLSCRSESNCDVRGPNRRTCKACRFQACLAAGMNAANSRFGRRSKYFKVSMAAAAQTINPSLQPTTVTFQNVNFLLLAAMYSSYVQNNVLSKIIKK